MMCNRYASNRQHRRRPIAGSSDCLPVTYQARTRCTNGVPANSSDSLILSTAVDRVHFQHSLLVGVAQSSVQEVDYHQLVIDIEPNFVLGEFFWQIYVCLFHLILEVYLRGIDTTSKNTGKTESTRNSLLIQHLNGVHPGRLWVFGLVWIVLIFHHLPGGLGWSTSEIKAKLMKL